jgi:hypothetical protein
MERSAAYDSVGVVNAVFACFLKNIAWISREGDSGVKGGVLCRSS